MVILAVDNNPQNLEKLQGVLAQLYPNAKVVDFIDPLLAFKYSMLNPVDILYTATQMKRLDGRSLAKMMREDHPQLEAYFIKDNQKPITTEKLSDLIVKTQKEFKVM